MSKSPKVCTICNSAYLANSNAQKYCSFCGSDRKRKLKSIDNVYRRMIDRCYNRRSHDYRWYGGKGIDVTIEWLKNRRTFVDWCLVNGFNVGLHLDRIDGTRGYSPGNCQFVTCKVNQRHRSNTTTNWDEGTRVCSFCGVTKLLEEFHRSATGRHYMCKDCRSITRSKAYQKQL